MQSEGGFMRFEFDDTLAAFRKEVRDAIAADLPDDMRARQIAYGGIQSEHRDTLAWTRILAKRGWSVPHWPVELGGQPWTPMQHFVFDEEMYDAYAPEVSWGGAHMVGPVIYTFGTDAQKQRFLPSIRGGDFIWAQGFSEPGAGSDLAHLRTSAVLEGDHYIVNGQKIWTSGAHDAEWGFFLVRTDAEVKPQRGISFLLIKLDVPGITIRRIPQINGEADLCEVFLDNVEVRADQLVGEPGQGWSYAKFLLDNERTTSSFIYWNKREVRRTKAIARAEGLESVPTFQARIARVEAEVTALEWSVLRTLSGEAYAYLLGARSLRFFPTDAGDRIPAPLWDAHVAGRTGVALGTRAATIFGGTLQVQKNIIAKLAFGL